MKTKYMIMLLVLGIVLISSCIKKEQIQTNTLAECKELSVTRKEFCYWDAAVATGDAGLCENVLFNKGSCYYDVAMMTKNANLCEKIALTTGRDGCYKEVATMTKDRSVCNKINNITIKNECFEAMQ